MDLVRAAELTQRFSGGDLGLSLAKLESDLRGLAGPDIHAAVSVNHVTHETLEAAALLKVVAGQINVTIHALGTLLCLPHLLKADEYVVSLSLGAGNTGKLWDLETDRRIAEFKFISWRGGSETIRQNSLFKDFFYLAEHDTHKSKHLYVLGTEIPVKFLSGQRALTSVLSRNAKLKHDVTSRYSDLKVVNEYYLPRRHLVSIEDVTPYVGSLVATEV